MVYFYKYAQTAWENPPNTTGQKLVDDVNKKRGYKTTEVSSSGVGTASSTAASAAAKATASNTITTSSNNSDSKAKGVTVTLDRPLRKGYENRYAPGIGYVTGGVTVEADRSGSKMSTNPNSKHEDWFKSQLAKGGTSAEDAIKKNFGVSDVSKLSKKQQGILAGFGGYKKSESSPDIASGSITPIDKGYVKTEDM